MSSPRSLFTVASLLSLSILGVLAPRPAQACGGTFCDAGPQVMPVDQSGENILFWIDQNDGDPHTEAHIQIQYEGDPDRFAWLVPVTQVPEISVGSQALFENLLTATQPVITVNTRFDGDCGPVAGGSGAGVSCGLTASLNDFPGSDGAETGFGDPGDGPEILDRGFAGAFEYVVLTGETIEPIVEWLDLAGYAQDDDAPPILDEYLQEGFVFVAFKLRGNAGTDEIHPLVIRYPGVEPCIPIRLTRIAATDDMAIRAFFLGQDRVVPQNWPHVSVNLTKLDWLGNTADLYLQLVGVAIDDAGGRAFVTEYAGTDSVVSTMGIGSNLWNDEAFVNIEPTAVVDELTSQNLIVCSAALGTCGFAHPQVEPLLARYLPPPEGIDAGDFWSCLECYADLIDPLAWDGGLFAAEFEQRISGPANHAAAMLSDAVYLTRLFTLISPHEMLEDPLFHETSSLGTVDNSITATQVFSCDETPDYMEFEDGTVVALEGSIYPIFDDMPNAAVIERVPMVGPPQVEVDNSEAIAEIVDDYNHTKLVGPSPWNCSTSRLRPQALLTMLALFGIAWFQRRPRQR